MIIDQYHNLNIARQTGAVLVISLFFVLILMILSLAIMNVAGLTEKLNANQRDKDIAFGAAEAALTQAENWLKSQPGIPKGQSSCSPSACAVFSANVLTNIQNQPDSWWAQYGTPYTGTAGQVKTLPYFIIEEYSFIPYDLSPEARATGLGYYYYRITAKATGSTNNSKSIIQSIYSVQFN